MWSKNKGWVDVQCFIGQISLIVSGVELVGDMNFKGVVQIDGIVCGVLQVYEGLVWVSVGGCVDGEIWVFYVIIDGQVDGDIYVIECLELGVQVWVKGNFYYGLIEIVMGVQIEGCLCLMIEVSLCFLELFVSVEIVDQLIIFLG